MTRTAFFGTPEAAVPSLDALAEATDVALVVTRPPRRKGRGRNVVPSPIGARAAELGIPVETPVGREELAGLPLDDVDVAVVVAFGALIPPAILEGPRAGFVNVHFSALPRWRGAAPVERALLAGDDEVGVSIMVMDEGLDTGPVLAAEVVPVGRRSAGELTADLAERGARLLVSVLPDHVSGALRARPQADEGATYAPKLSPGEGHLDAHLPADDLDRRVRAMTPRPGAYLETPHGRLGVVGAEAVPDGPPPGDLAVIGRRLVLGTPDGGLWLRTVHPAGRRPMDGRDWANGIRGDLGPAS